MFILCVFFNVDEVKKRMKGKGPLKVKDDSPEVISDDVEKGINLSFFV